VYVYTKPVTLGVREEVSGLTLEKLRVSVELSSIELRVRDVATLLLELWKRHGYWSIDPVVAEIKKAFRRHVQEILPSTTIEEILTKPQRLREAVAEKLKGVVEPYGLEVLDLEVSTNVDEDTYNYYFWHIVNEIPAHYTFLLSMLDSIPESIQKNTPRAVEAMIVSLLLKTSPSVIEYLKAALKSEEGE